MKEIKIENQTVVVDTENKDIENENMKSLKEHCEEFNHNDVYETVCFECEANGIWVANWDYRMNGKENTIMYIIVYNDYEIHTLIKKY
jgi:hypothetical protein